MYKKYLESSWLCIGVCDPLLFDDPALGGSFFLGKPGAKYVDALIERMEDLFTTSPKLRNVFVIGGSASAIIALAVSSRLKAINISFGPIFTWRITSSIWLKRLWMAIGTATVNFSLNE